MGYILPLPHFQYKDYQKRVAKDKLDPYYIEQPYKAILEITYQDIADEEEEDRQYNYEPYNSSDYKVIPPEPPVNTKKLAEITGMGQHFSETI